MIVKPDEISKLIKQQIESYSSKPQFSIGHRHQVGDGIARVQPAKRDERRIMSLQTEPTVWR